MPQMHPEMRPLVKKYVEERGLISGLAPALVTDADFHEGVKNAVLSFFLLVLHYSIIFLALPHFIRILFNWNNFVTN